MRSSRGRRRTHLAMLGTICLGIAGCGSIDQAVTPTPNGRFASDIAFLRQHTDVVLLADPSREAKVAVAPVYQGRVMTSTTGGSDAPSFGWIGRAASASGRRQPHMNVCGGEDRFWLGPEGGQYALFFKAGDPFDLDHWQGPGAFGWGSWGIAGQSASAVRLRKRMTLVDYSGTQMGIGVDRA